MVTRRTALRTGLAFVSAALGSTAWPAASGTPVAPRRAARPIDALLVDEDIGLAGTTAALIRSGLRTSPVVGVRLDAGGHAALKRLLGRSRTVAGISSGATLFCLERIAWDHGFRLVARSAWSAAGPGTQALALDVAAFLAGVHLPAEGQSPAARAYRPSRDDGLLHAWLMHTSAREG